MGPRPQGKPDLIEETADAMNRVAGHLQNNVGIAQLNLPGNALIGPARAGIDAGIANLRTSAAQAVIVLKTEAAQLLTEAGALRIEQKVWDEQAKAEREEREEKAAEAKQCIAVKVR
ncbi:MAG: hypothetical protein Q7T55_19305 [Solirubrobacteraceae bacterium]|nr:hypothetical protein [Solirubrobacteraceae bacterium]